MSGILIGEERGRSGEQSFGEAPTSTRKFIVRSDNRADFEADIVLTPGLPRLGDTHPRNPYIFALDFSITQDDVAWYKWTVEIGYRVPDDGEETPQDDDPLAQPATVTVDGEEYVGAAAYAVDPTTGEPFGAILSSAFEAFDPQPETEFELLTISITRNEPAVISLATFFDYYNAVNDDDWTFGDVTFTEAQVLLKPKIGGIQRYISPVTGFETLYREVNYLLRCNPIGWDLNVLDQGTYYLDGVGNKVSFMTTASADGETPPQPRIGNLDGLGGELDDGDPPVFLPFKTKKRRDFSALNLPAGP